MHTLTESLAELDLSLTLRAGQVFCWEFQPDTNEWIGVIGQTIFRLSQVLPDGVSFTFTGDLSVADATKVLRDFFQLETDLCELLNFWGNRDETFAKLVPVDSKFAGIRICRQDPFECLISFIVSANNNIKRIHQNLMSIRRKYGKALSSDIHAFPTVTELSAATAEELRSLGLGYRAEYIVKTVSLLQAEGMMDTLYGLRKESDVRVAREFLVQLQGVGRKVADCVCLYSLDFPSVAPVDTHMFQIAQRLFSKSIKKDNAMHDVIQEAMIKRFGDKAGWAHCFLFAADLRDLQDSTAKRSRIRE